MPKRHPHWQGCASHIALRATITGRASFRAEPWYSQATILKPARWTASRSAVFVNTLTCGAFPTSCISGIASPELQPAETLWVHVDEPIVNRHFASLAGLDAVVAKRCVALGIDRDLIRGQAGFHWWLRTVTAN